MQHHRRDVAAAFQTAGQRCAFAYGAGDIKHAVANGEVGDYRGRDFQGIHQRHGAFAQDRQGAGKTRRLHGAQHPADHGHIEQQRMPAQLRGWLQQRPTRRTQGGEHQQQQQPAVVTQPCTQGDHRLGQHGQRLAAVHKNFDHVRHHIAEQKADDGERSNQQNQRVHQRQLDLLARGMAGFGVVSELFEYMAQMAAALARCHGGAKQFREGPGER